MFMTSYAGLSHVGLVEGGAGLVHPIQVPLGSMQALGLHSRRHVLRIAGAALWHRPIGSLNCIGSCIRLHRA